MKITVHEAEVNAGYARPIFRGIRREDIVKEIAAICRKEWKNHDWGMEDDGLNERSEPKMPTSDEEIVNTFFYGDPDEDTADDENNPWVCWTSYELDLSPPYNTDINLQVDNLPFSVRRTKPRNTRTMVVGGGAVLDGGLITDGGFVNDVLEGFILALTAAGFPVHVEEFKKCLSDYCEGLVDRLGDLPSDDDELEDMERSISVRGLSVLFDIESSAWQVMETNEKRYMPKRHPKVGFETRREAMKFAYNDQ